MIKDKAETIIALLAVLMMGSSILSASTSIPLTETDKKIWSEALKKSVMRPPCCGACPVFTMADAKELWPYVAGQAQTARGKLLWKIHHIKILRTFRELAPERYQTLYGSLKEEKESSPAEKNP